MMLPVASSASSAVTASVRAAFPSIARQLQKGIKRLNGFGGGAEPGHYPPGTIPEVPKPSNNPAAEYLRAKKQLDKVDESPSGGGDSSSHPSKPKENESLRGEIDEIKKSVRELGEVLNAVKGQLENIKGGGLIGTMTARNIVSDKIAAILSDIRDLIEREVTRPALKPVSVLSIPSTSTGASAGYYGGDGVMRIQGFEYLIQSIQNIKFPDRISIANPIRVGAPVKVRVEDKVSVSSWGKFQTEDEKLTETLEKQLERFNDKFEKVEKNFEKIHKILDREENYLNSEQIYDLPGMQKQIRVRAREAQAIGALATGYAAGAWHKFETTEQELKDLNGEFIAKAAPREMAAKQAAVNTQLLTDENAFELEPEDMGGDDLFFEKIKVESYGDVLLDKVKEYKK